MAELGLPWLVLVLGTGGIAMIATWLGLEHARLRAVMLLLHLGMLALCAGPLVQIAGEAHPLYADPWTLWIPRGVLVVDELSAVLLPFACLLWTVAFGIAPRASLLPGAARRAVLAELLVLGIFMVRHPILLAILWAGSILALLASLRGAERLRERNLATRYLGASALLFGAGAGLLELSPASHPWSSQVGVVLVLVAILARKGIVPFHSWLPEIFEGGRLGSDVLFSTPQVAAYAAAVLLMPRAGPWVFEVIGALSLLTSVYGAACALTQQDPRRAYAYFLMSQSALVMAGVGSTSIEGLTGGLCLWLSSGLALAGFGFTLWMLEARHGRLTLARFNGGYEKRPLLAASFLLLGLASVGFPGTLGFVGQELLMAGELTQFPIMGFAVVAASALNAIVVLRMYFRLFCGRAEGFPPVRLRRRELATVAAVTGILLGFGLLPKPLLASRSRAAAALLQARAEANPPTSIERSYH